MYEFYNKFCDPYTDSHWPKGVREHIKQRSLSFQNPDIRWIIREKEKILQQKYYIHVYFDQSVWINSDFELEDKKMIWYDIPIV